MATNTTSATWLKSFDQIRSAVVDDPMWSVLLGAPGEELPPIGIHLAVCVEPFLGYVLDGTKTIESRFSVNRCPPFGKVGVGDAVILKESGGPVVGLARVRTVWPYELDESSWHTIREQFAQALCAQDPDFWEGRRGAAYATLMAIHHVLKVGPIEWEKKDRRGWVVLRSGEQPSLFGDEDGN